MVPQVGQRIGPYEILGRLGSGGMGLVFSAWDARLQRDVAIKLLREEYATPEMRSRFLQEARAASGLNHPNICTIFDIGEQEGDPYLVMELLKGETLRSRINQGNISPREILRVAHDIADALSVAHVRGIIHRDIKPANIILVGKPGGGFGTKVLDFGLAKIDSGYGADSLLDLTNTGTTVGTVSYMSPEQARGEALDFRSDLFSLGVMLYEMATGRLPFQGATSALVFVQLLGHAPDPIRPHNPQVTEELEQLILCLLEKDRNLRFQSAAQLMEAVDLIPSSGSTPSRPSFSFLSPPPVPGFTPTERRASALPVPVERRNSARVYPRSPGPRNGEEPPTLPVRRSGASAASVPVAKSTPPAFPDADSKTIRAAMSQDDVLRPVRRIATPNSENSDYLKAVRESSGMLPAVSSIPPLPEAAPAAVVVPPVLPPAPAARMEQVTPPSASVAPRNITTQSVRPISSQADVPALNLPRITSVRPAPRVSIRTESSRTNAAAVSEPYGKPGLHVASEPKPRMWLLFVGLGVMAVIGVVAYFVLWPHSTTPANIRTISIVVAHVEDMTGGGLSNSVASGIELDLAQSPILIVQVPSSLKSGLRSLGDDDTDVTSLENSRKAAHPIGVTEVLNGAVRISGNYYVVSLRINSVATGGEVLTAEETAQSREQIPDAIDRLAIDVRNGLGESSESVGKNSVALSKEATSNLDALQSYAVGMGFLSIGSLEEAEIAFQRAVSDDPHFPQPYLRLAEIYRQQRAFVAAANEAAFAQNTAQNASERTQLLGQASYALNGSGDVPAVVALMQQLTNTFPNAVGAHVQAATALRQQGKFSESLEAAQAVLRQSPLNNSALAAAEMAMIATDHTDAAAPFEATAVRAGRPHPELTLLMSYLNSDEQGPIDTSADPAAHLSLGVVQAQLLDAIGATAAALRVWGQLAASSANHPQLVSGAADLLSVAALNRALTGDCASSNMLLQRAAVFPPAADTIFRSGLAYALCGNLDAARDSSALLEKNYPVSFAVRGYYTREINAVIQWKTGDTHGGLEMLAASKEYDLISLTPYLRGLMHIADKQAQVAISDFNVVLQHKGAMVIMDPLVIPLAQAGLGRAYLANGDHMNSGLAYAKFLTMWKGADSGQLLVSEARANSR